MTSPSNKASPSTEPSGLSTTSSPAAEPTNAFASTGGLLDLRGPWTSTTDPRGDANPAIDITEVSFADVGKYATARLSIAHLNWTGSFEVGFSRGNDEDGYIGVGVIPHLNHTITVVAHEGSRSGDFNPVGCGIATRYDVSLEEVLIQVPWSCIPDEGATTVSFSPETTMPGDMREADDVTFVNESQASVPHTP